MPDEKKRQNERMKAPGDLRSAQVQFWTLQAKLDRARKPEKRQALARELEIAKGRKGMNKSLYDENERYTEAALALDKEAGSLLRPLMERYQGEGYSIREIAGIVQKAVFDLECEAILEMPCIVESLPARQSLK
jgi:hypothetical protein